MTDDEIREALRGMESATREETMKIALAACLRNIPPFRMAVQRCEELSESTGKIVADFVKLTQTLRDNHKSFDECWAAMNLIITACDRDRDALTEMLGYAVTQLAVERRPAADTADSAAKKMQAAAQVVDLAREAFGDNL